MVTITVTIMAVLVVGVTATIMSSLRFLVGFIFVVRFTFVVRVTATIMATVMVMVKIRATLRFLVGFMFMLIDNSRRNIKKKGKTEWKIQK